MENNHIYEVILPSRNYPFCASTKERRIKKRKTPPNHWADKENCTKQSVVLARAAIPSLAPALPWHEDCWGQINTMDNQSPKY